MINDLWDSSEDKIEKTSIHYSNFYFLEIIFEEGKFWLGNDRTFNILTTEELLKKIFSISIFVVQLS